MFAPVFEAAAAAYPECRFGKLDTEANKGLLGDLDIQHIPTLLIYRDGILVYREPGTLQTEALERLIAQVKELDMDQVRADVEAREREARSGDESENFQND